MNHLRKENKMDHVEVEMPLMTHNCIIVESYPNPPSVVVDVVIYDRWRNEDKNPIRIKIDTSCEYSKQLLVAIFQQYAENIFNQLKMEINNRS